MKKRGRCLRILSKLSASRSSQLISFDLVFGILILILGIIFTLEQIDKLYSRPSAKLNLQADFIFNNLELNLKNKKYAASTGYHEFIDNFKINEEELINFQNLPYNSEDGNDFNDMKSLVIKTLSMPDLNLDFCLYFGNKTGHIVPVNGRSGIGFSSSTSKIYVGENNVECGQTIIEGSPLKAAPDCSEYYPHATNVFKPVIRQKSIMRMNVLICGRESK